MFGKLLKMGAGWAANPLLGSAMAGKEIAGGLNKIPSRGYEGAMDKQQQIYDMYGNYAKKNPYDKYYDPKLRKYQTNALNRLYRIGTSNKLDPQAQAQLNDIRKREGQLERGAREAIMQNAYERGAGTSSGNLMDQLINAQQASERRTNQQTDVAANQWQRSLDSLLKSSDLASNVNTQDLQRARAQDLFNQYILGGQASTLSNQGQLGLQKAQAQNQFWGGLLGAGIGALAGGPAGAQVGGQMGGQATAPTSGLQMANNAPRLTKYDWENVMRYQPGYNPIL